MSPIYLIDRAGPKTLVSCTVTLPNSIGLSSRSFTSSTLWKSERLARADAAFEACSNLYENQLINDHLLPADYVEEEAERVYRSIEKRNGVVAADLQMNVWTDLAASWAMGKQLFASRLTFRTDNYDMIPVTAILPSRLMNVPEFVLHLDRDARVIVSIDDGQPIALNEFEIGVARQATHRILYSLFRSRMTAHESDFPVIFYPYQDGHHLKNWLSATAGTLPAATITPNLDFTKLGLVRYNSQEFSPFVLRGFYEQEDEDDPARNAKTMLRVSNFSKNIDLSMAAAARPSARDELLRPEDCTIDNLPLTFSLLAIMVPRILHNIHHSMIVNALCNDELREVHFSNRNLVLQAITSPAVTGEPNYERLEFLGDCLLKLYAVTTAMADNPYKHEGYLSQVKDHLVSNSPLAVVSKRLHLDRYVLTTANRFKATRWRPLYNSSLLHQQHPTSREISSKVLADVVEALYGAAFIDGGEPRVLNCLRLCYPQTTWRPLSESFAKIAEASLSSASTRVWDSFAHVETMISYSFTNKALLLEALTHPSHLSTSANPSYQRLEFLGDAILDKIVTSTIFDHSSDLPPARMTLLKFAAVNASFLAYLVFASQVSIPIAQIVNYPLNFIDRPPTIIPSTIERSLPDFMRRGCQPELEASLADARARFLAVQSEIAEALRSSDTYPWRQLTSLVAPKAVSDLLESTLGAMAIDAHGDLAPCERWLEKLGLLPWLRRALADKIDARSPRAILHCLAMPERATFEYQSDVVRDGENHSETGREKGPAEFVNDPIALLLGGQISAAPLTWRTRILCRAFVGKRLVSEGVGADKYAAITAAAEQAVHVLNSEGRARSRLPTDGMGANPAQKVPTVHVSGESTVNELATTDDHLDLMHDGLNDENNVKQNRNDHNVNEEDLDGKYVSEEDVDEGNANA